ncbi:MAG: LysR family transcriptional regulator, partial [Maritimibacter sp.]|nr:LysR family transcriptional regulator [Maritimibacter sp.]
MPGTTRRRCACWCPQAGASTIGKARNSAVIEPDWDDLKVFLAVARGESLSAAAKVLKRDPATVGRRVARLEEALGAALFVRTPAGYGLTEAGGRLIDHAERVEQAIGQGAEALRGAPGQLT